MVVAEGEAVRFLKKFKKVKLCEGGKLKYKKRSEVEVVPACNGGFVVSLSFFQTRAHNINIPNIQPRRSICIMCFQ